MGMSIDEHITMLRSYKKLMWGTECDKRYGESFREAIDIMQKYKKIEQIISNFDESSNYYLTLEQIAKVVEE